MQLPLTICLCMAFALTTTAQTDVGKTQQDCGTARISWEFLLKDPGMVSPAGLSLFLRPEGGVLVLDNSGSFYAVNSGGHLIQNFALDPSDFFTKPDTDGAGRVVAGTGSGMVYCFGTKGEVIWSIGNSQDETAHRSTYACFGPNETVWIVESGGRISVRDRSGVPTSTISTGKNIEPGLSFFDAPDLVVGTSELLVVSSAPEGGGVVNCLSMNGQEKWAWENPGSALYGLNLLPDGTVLALAHQQGLFALNANGSQRWVWTNPDPMGDASFHFILPVFSADGSVFLASDELFVVLRADGTELIHERFDGDNWPIFIGSDGFVYVRNIHQAQETSRGEPGIQDSLILAYGSERRCWKLPTGLISFAGPGNEGEFYAVHMEYENDANPVTIVRLDLRGQ